MNIETELSSVKSDVRQLSRTCSNLKSDIRQMMSDVTKFKEVASGSFFTMVKAPALVEAIRKIDGLGNKVADLAKLADEKARQAKAAREAAEKQLELAKEQDKRLQKEHEARLIYEEKQDLRLQKEHENRLEAEKRGIEQGSRITTDWVKYQDAQKDPNLVRRYILLKKLFGEDFGFDVSFVKDHVLLKQYEELCTSSKKLLNEIKEELGGQIAGALDEAHVIQQNLHNLATVPAKSSSHIAECKMLLKQIETTHNIIPDLSFNLEEQHVISQQIERWSHDASMLASAMHELKLANIVTENVLNMFKDLASDYDIEKNDLQEIYRSTPVCTLEKNDWSLFFERVPKHLPENFHDDLQIFMDFVAQKADQPPIDLCKEIFCNLLIKVLPMCIISEHLPFTQEVFSQNVLGYLPIGSNQFVVFLEKSLFWMDCQRLFLERSTYTCLSESFPCEAKEAIKAIHEPISKLEFVESKELTLDDKLAEMESRYHVFWQADQEAKERRRLFLQKMKRVVAYILSVIWLFLGAAVSIGILDPGGPNPSIKRITWSVTLFVVAFLIPAGILSGMCFVLSRRNEKK